MNGIPAMRITELLEELRACGICLMVVFSPRTRVVGVVIGGVFRVPLLVD
jgi:hypothetical protein